VLVILVRPFQALLFVAVFEIEGCFGGLNGLDGTGGDLTGALLMPVLTLVGASESATTLKKWLASVPV